MGPEWTFPKRSMFVGYSHLCTAAVESRQEGERRMLQSSEDFKIVQLRPGSSVDHRGRLFPRRVRI